MCLLRSSAFLCPKSCTYDWAKASIATSLKIFLKKYKNMKCIICRKFLFFLSFFLSFCLSLSLSLSLSQIFLWKQKSIKCIICRKFLSFSFCLCLSVFVSLSLSISLSLYLFVSLQHGGKNFAPYGNFVRERTIWYSYRTACVHIHNGRQQYCQTTEEVFKKWLVST